MVLTSAKERMFCAGANIYMLGQSSHAWKVNFCKFTNETRNGIEDSSRHSGLKFLAAVNGTCAGGGYELALACDEILLVDDRSSTVSLPEVPLLGVLPGTGGLTRVVDKRKVRRDLADIFCTNADGVRADRARDWKLIDGSAPPSKFADLVRERALALAAESDRPAEAKGVALTPLRREVSDDAIRYRWVSVELDRDGRRATLTVTAPDAAPEGELDAILAAGADWWPLAMARELDDAILTPAHQRASKSASGCCKTRGDAAAVLAVRPPARGARRHWFVRETIGMLLRARSPASTSPRAASSRWSSADSCFAGTLAELALAADRSYMLDARRRRQGAAHRALGANFGALPMATAAPAGAALLRRGRGAAVLAPQKGVGTERRRRAARAARPGHRHARTTSTGTTRCASPSRSAPASRPMR